MTLRGIGRTPIVRHIILVLCCAQVGLAAGQTDGQRSSAQTLSPMQAYEVHSAALKETLSNQMQQLVQAQKAEAASERSVNWFLVAGAVVAGVLVIRWGAPRLGELLNRRYNPWAPASEGTKVVDEEQAFAKFAEDFTFMPARPNSPKPRSETVAVVAAEDKALPPDPIERFLHCAPKELAAMRATFSKIGATADPAARQQALEQLQRAVLAFKANAQFPALLTFWQMAGALEGLLAQLAARPTEVTPSTLRSIAAGLDLLKSLCAHNLKPDLLTDPPVRILAADDDAICRHALSFSLSKVLGPPDLASDGLAALALVEKIAYDVVFLDVEMPGIDGFELCTRIAATEVNWATPVVFVTRHSDFESRTQSCLRGGRDLLGKPFLTFELAVKALTMVMQRRLQAGAAPPTGAGQETIPAVASPATLEPAAAEAGQASGAVA